MFDLFPDMPQAAKFVAAFVVVLALIGLTAWLVRRFGSNRLGAAARGRQPRLAVIDAANVDGRRRLVLIRRDNVEHLMMIGGPNDVVVEPNIVRAAARDVRETGREVRAAEPSPRQVPVADNGGSWPLQPSVEPPVTPVAPRPLRGNVPEEPWVASEPPLPLPPVREPARPRSDSLTGMASSEFANKVSSEFDFGSVRPAPRAEATPSPTPAVQQSEHPAAPQGGDRNLAEMAQRLEAALRRPGTSEYQPPVTDPLAAPVKPEPKFEAPKAEPKLETPRPAPKVEARPEPKAEVKNEPKAEAKPAAQKNPFDSLEQEMANLLGRQPGKT
jgi:flagellar protein FliO/FliZ